MNKISYSLNLIKYLYDIYELNKFIISEGEGDFFLLKLKLYSVNLFDFQPKNIR